MRSVGKLPEGYKECYSLDLQKDKKTALLVNGVALAVTVVMAAAMSFYIPVWTFFTMENGFVNYIIRMAAFIVFMFLYLILHEAVHGIAMKICGTKKVKYGFTGLYAFAGSDDYYGKGAYKFIALAPVVFWGIVLAAVNCIVPVEFFWLVYFIQILNVSGAAGDMYVTLKFSKLPKDILVNDSGVGMKVYSKEQY
ncbi:MAG: DUF3267 domain-containing protein [Clostridia bacterium]|nr:DUF3267 domain-containing protein [Clostridia bacterium]